MKFKLNNILQKVKRNPLISIITKVKQSPLFKPKQVKLLTDV